MKDSLPVPTMPRRRVAGLALVAALCALASTAQFWRGDAWTLHQAVEHADSAMILHCASTAGAKEWLRWWHGSWIEAGVSYYRPVSSTLMGLEWKVFGSRALGFCATGWVLHAINAVLLFLLALRLFRGTPTRRSLMALGASLGFTLFRFGYERPAQANVTWWPAQTDILSLTFSLASPLALDVALTRPGKLRLGLPLALFLPALLSKEMAVILPLPAALLAAARGREWPRVLASYLAVAVALLAVRHFAVPNAMGPKWKPRHLLGKALLYLGGTSGPMVNVGAYWQTLAVDAIFVETWFLRRRKVEAPWIVLAALVTVGLCAQVFDGSWASVFLDQPMREFASILTYFL